MIFTEQDLDNLSRLARIDITSDEKSKMLADMQAILGYVSVINDIQGELVSGSEQIYNVVRDDVATRVTASHTEAILREAPATEGGYVKVMQVLK